MLNMQMDYTSPQGTEHPKAHIAVTAISHQAYVEEGLQKERISYSVGVYKDEQAYLDGKQPFQNNGYSFVCTSSNSAEWQVEEDLRKQEPYKTAVDYE